MDHVTTYVKEGQSEVGGTFTSFTAALAAYDFGENS